MKNKKLKAVVAVCLPLLMTGCLVTRQQVRESTQPEKMSPEQQQRVNSEVRYNELESQTRELLGRVETVENSVNILNADKSGSRMEAQTEKKALTERMKILEEALSKMENQYLLLSQKVEALQYAPKSAAKESGSDKNSGGNSYTEADAEFTKKNWKEAAVLFQKYRDLNPKGKRYAEATYKIGYSFQEISMKTEAKVFYSEVVEKFPKSEWAQKANSRLKNLK